MSMQKIIPAQYQPGLPKKKLILEEAPGEEAVPMDVVFVGGGPAGLAGAIELAKLVKKDAENGGGLGEIEIRVLEKAERLGDHLDIATCGLARLAWQMGHRRLGDTETTRPRAGQKLGINHRAIGDDPHVLQEFAAEQFEATVNVRLSGRPAG